MRINPSLMKKENKETDAKTFKTSVNGRGNCGWFLDLNKQD